MTDRVFLDTNILVYANLEDPHNEHKREAVVLLLDSLNDSEIVISVQVLNELYNVMIRNNVKDDIIQKKLKVISENVIVSDISMDVVRRCWSIRKRYKYSYYDCLILASALENKCGIIYSEDMQHGQKVAGSLVIQNPFSN